ncbi:DNA-binding transcriptional regulator, LysR family [Lutimaribacter pacificus]|uniref:Transcriptional regulator, LysR family n=2 Tax=Lutimaribacter pacificus TaxID=391948 RepID=A0A1H0M9K0_9RHOB|nr:DNA-binding transcriptional regulator, LysR family [Lutimaribacter pacificus]SHK79236.1 transcriptional regulator, LysR family [Lutimaribacter pacificus]
MRSRAGTDQKQMTGSKKTDPTPFDTSIRARMGHVTLHKVEVFRTVAQLSSVTKAAKQLGIAQPAVTAHVRSLEEKFETKLINRVGRSVELTEAGKRVYRWANSMVVGSTEIARELQHLKAGEVGAAWISSSMVVGTYVLPGIVIDFQRRFAGARIRVNTSNPRVAMEAVRLGESDFAVTILDKDQPFEDLEFEHLYTEPLRLVAAPDSTLVGSRVTPPQLATLPFVTPPAGYIARDVEDDILRSYGIVRRNIVLEFGHPEAILQAVRADRAVSIILESSIEADIAAGTLRMVEIADAPINVPLYLIRRKTKIFSNLQNRLVGEIRDYFTRKTLDRSAG